MMMKNLLKISLLAVMVFVSAHAYAYDDTFSIKVKGSNEKSVVFYISEAQDVALSIYSADKELLYSQKIHAVKSVAKTYNLEAFLDGTYFIKLETDKKITAYEVRIQNGKTTVEKPFVINKPILTKENDVIIMRMENSDNSTFEVKVLNEHNDELYSKIFADKSKLSTKFDIAQTDAKELTFIVKYKDQEFIQTMYVN
jgi:hypothetical protein